MHMALAVKAWAVNKTQRPPRRTKHVPGVDVPAGVLRLVAAESGRQVSARGFVGDADGWDVGDRGVAALAIAAEVALSWVVGEVSGDHKK